MSVTVKLCVSIVCIDMTEKKTMIVFEKQDGMNVINIPSGHVEPREDPLVAAHRELIEETSVVAGQLYFAGNTMLETPKGCYFTMVYACFKPPANQIGTVIIDDDVYDAKWLMWHEIAALKDQHRNGFIEDKVRMAISCLDAVTNPKVNNHSPWFRHAKT